MAQPAVSVLLSNRVVQLSIIAQIICVGGYVGRLTASNAVSSKAGLVG